MICFREGVDVAPQLLDVSVWKENTEKTFSAVHAFHFHAYRGYEGRRAYDIAKRSVVQHRSCTVRIDGPPASPTTWRFPAGDAVPRKLPET